MTTNLLPERASPSSPSSPSPPAASPPSSQSLPALASVAQVHHQSQDLSSTLPLHRIELSSTPGNSTASLNADLGQDIAAPVPVATDIAHVDTNTYTGRPVLDTSHRYSIGHATTPASARPVRNSVSLGHIYPNPSSGAASASNAGQRRRSHFGGQISILTPTPEVPSAGQIANTLTNAGRSVSTGFHTFAPDFVSHDSEHGNSAYHSGQHSPSFSISSFSGILPASASISNIAATGQAKPPALEHRHPIAVKDFDSIHILGQAQQTAIKTLCSSRVLSRIDTIGWFSILGAQKFPNINTSQDAYDIEMATTCMAIEFGANNAQTQNFNSLILQLLSQIKLIKEQDYKGDIPSHAYNAMFLTRIFLNHFISHLSSTDLVASFEGSDLSAEAQLEARGVVSFKGCRLGVDQSIVEDPRSYGEQLIQGIIGIILNLDAGSSPSAYEFYEETLNLVIVMSSTQLQLPSSEPSDKNYFLNLVLEKFSHVADQLTLRLLWNFTDQRPSPPLTGSLVYSAYSYLFAKAGSSISSEAHPIADRSVLVLLLLLSQAKLNPSWDAFKKSIRTVRDERGSMADDQKEETIFTSFRKIFHVICQQIHCEEVCLLLHVLLVENTYFRTYVLSRTDPETLYLPILRMVYEGVEGKTNYSQVYVLLVILLLFSQDDVFNESIQKITMTYQPWFTERLLKSISLGGLATAIIIRTIQYNLAQHKDVYFHTNSLAILANMSNSLQDMHPYVSQRLVTLFDIVARRYQKLVTKKTQQDEDVENNADVIIYGDMVILVLEIINSTLTHKLKANPQLVYSLLHKQEMFAVFRNDLKFKDLIHNIEQAVNYFQQKVSEANINPPTPEEVALVIQNASRTWPPNLMKTFPDIKFEYEEEQQSNEFFCPYVWSLLYRNTFVYWDEEKAKILHDYRVVMNDEHAFEGVPTGSQSVLP
ncbi:dymeclin [Entomortierella parvispora]|uniref:Dymeclin n=1 Tax=Entomortierella parvispora TaxID=205924 RepID=A0A9P3HK76_9FUNG|nr:dymeclin [Entomortierella parvispora]